MIIEWKEGILLKCNLLYTELEEIHLLFSKINKSQAEIKAGLQAQEDYAATINEINCLTADDSEFGEQLCRQALDQLNMIKAAELAEINLQNCRQELDGKYDIPSSRCREGVKASA